MMLGDVIARLTDDGAAEEIVLALGDLRLLVALRERAAAEGMGLAVFTRDAVRYYGAEASDEEWITLLGLMSRTNDPGLTCLRRAFENALAVNFQENVYSDPAGSANAGKHQ